MLVRGELHQLGQKHVTDKAGKGHDYLRFYEHFLRSFKNDPFTLVELGVGPVHRMGRSLLMWRDYFPAANIVGVDIKPEAKSVEDERIAIEIANLGFVKNLIDIAGRYNPLIVVDDASHLWSHQILALETLFWSVQRGGLYIFEDLNTSFGELASRYGRGQYINAYSYLATLLCLVNGKGDDHPSFAITPPTPMQQALASEIDFIAVYGHTAVIGRKHEEDMRRSETPKLSQEERQAKREKRIASKESKSA